jgi:hypothetical protein
MCFNFWQIQDELKLLYNLPEGPPSVSSISRVLKREGFKQKIVHQVKDAWNTPRTLKAREAFIRDLEHTMIEAKQMIYMDEQSWNILAHRNVGRARVGQRAIQILPSGAAYSHSLALSVNVGSGQLYSDFWLGGTTGIHHLMPYFEKAFAKFGVHRRRHHEVSPGAPFLFVDNARPHHKKVQGFCGV